MNEKSEKLIDDEEVIDEKKKVKLRVKYCILTQPFELKLILHESDILSKAWDMSNVKKVSGN